MAMIVRVIVIGFAQKVASFVLKVVWEVVGF